MTPSQIEAKAQDLYHIYCHAVGGVAFNGDPLPDWSEFGSDPSKTKQAEAWRRVAEAALGLVPPAAVPRSAVPDGIREKLARRAGEDESKKPVIPKAKEGETLTGITAPAPVEKDVTPPVSESVAEPEPVQKSPTKKSATKKK